MGRTQSRDGWARDIIVVEQRDSTLKTTPFVVKIRGMKSGIKDRDAKIVRVVIDGQESFLMSVNQLRPTSERHVSSRDAAGPTKEELASLNLQYGKNEITFTLDYERWGDHVRSSVTCCIFLWKWDRAIVVTDIDGTITKSNFHNKLRKRVVAVFSKIKENGYEILYVTGRPAPFTHKTRKLLETEQDGKRLPCGPVIHTPNGYFPAILRYVSGNQGKHFKQPYLENVRSLFPPDVQPFFAAFGDSTTDEKSYNALHIIYTRIYQPDKRTIKVKRGGKILATYNEYDGYDHFIGEKFPTRRTQESAATFQRYSHNREDYRQMHLRSRRGRLSRIQPFDTDDDYDDDYDERRPLVQPR